MMLIVPRKFSALFRIRKPFRVLFLLMMMGISSNLSAQQTKEITGEVIAGSDNLPLPGVNIIIKGTSKGTITDMEGNFSLEAAPEDVLVFSFLGFESQEVTVGSQDEISIILEESTNSLDDIVVIGYGTQKRSDLTGSVSTIDSEEMTKVSNSDVGQLLQGRTAGVTVMSDGQPGASPNVKIRGVATFGNSQPLYVVDGVPVGNAIRDFSPNDIESIQILKDASAGAIYGSRAANGVVIITTKNGKKNSPLQIRYKGYYGIDEVAQNMPVLGRRDYQMITNEKRRNAGMSLIPGNDPESELFIDDINTDWQEVGLQTGKRQNHNVNFSGGGENATYSITLDYFDNEGIFVGNGPDYQRYSGRINTQLEKGIFKISPSLYYMHSYENSLTFRGDVLTGGRPPLINDLVNAIPTLGVYDENNIGGYAGTDSNIHQAIILNVPGINSLFKNTVQVDKMFAVVNPQLKLIDTENSELTYKLNLSYDKTIAKDFSFVPEFQMGYFFNSGKSLLDEATREYTSSLVENTLNYKQEFGRHTIDLLAGITYQENETSNRNGHSESLPSPYIPVLNNGTNQTAGGTLYKSALNSYLGRINYNFDDRYLVTASIRRDGSSRFSEDNRWGTFPSIALGWRLSNEEFFKVPSEIVNNLKLRGSYGELGNQNIGDYLYQPVVNRNILYNFFSGNSVNKAIGGIVTNIPDSDIKWENTASFNIALDATLLNNALDFTLEYYNKKTTDVLVGVPIPITSGSINVSPTTNAGSLRNSGFDIQMGYHFQNESDFSFDISANVSTLKNEVLELGGNNEPIYGVGSITQTGGEIGAHFGYVYEGIFQSQEEVADHAFQSAATAPGDIKFKDVNDDGVINDNDRKVLGSAMPDVTYGLNFTANYKNFDFTLFTSGAAGYYINSRLYRSLMLSTDYLNAHEDILDRWTPENTNTNIPRLIQNDPNSNGRDSNRPGWLQKGDYLRINNVTFGYTLPDDLFEGVLKHSRIYGAVQNLHTFTKYKGYNPDFNSGVFEPGYDNGTYPKPRTYMLGVELSF